MNNEYTTQWFRDKLFETTLEEYKQHWDKYGRREACDIDSWLAMERIGISDQVWIHHLFEEYEDTLCHAFGSGYDKEFDEFIQGEIDRYIDNGELETYIHNQMEDYCRDLAREL